MGSNSCNQSLSLQDGKVLSNQHEHQSVAYRPTIVIKGEE